MGNDQSNSKKRSPSERQISEQEKLDSLIDQYFQRMTGNANSISYHKLVELFDEDLAGSLFNYLTGNASEKTTLVSREEFNRKFQPLCGTSTDIYVKILQPVYHFIKVCSYSAGAEAVRGDEKFIRNLVSVMNQGPGSDSLEKIQEWRRSQCPKFCSGVQSRILAKATGQNHNMADYSSDILTPLQMWFIQCCLSDTYFPNRNEKVCKQWTPLYTSLQHGISTNRFETFVFDYRGPTVTIFRLKDQKIVVLAADQEWRHSSNRFGGIDTSYFEILPNIKRIDAANSIYCNLKLRSCASGLSFKNELNIDKEFNEVLDIEVWGCANSNTLSEQQKLKNWQKQQAEKHKKVPLPGNWDDNPDKTLLEMAGFEFSNERANMEMEAKRIKDISTNSASEQGCL